MRSDLLSVKKKDNDDEVKEKIVMNDDISEQYGDDTFDNESAQKTGKSLTLSGNLNNTLLNNSS